MTENLVVIITVVVLSFGIMLFARASSSLS